ncbi:MAG: dTMP kinase [Pseudomonadota bacterium]
MFITLEGGEGTGKSTLSKRLATALRAEGQDLLVTREPGGTPLAEKVRDIALAQRPEHPLSALAMALLMNAARADHLDTVIRPALARGGFVICDRFADSTLAYQSVQGGVSFETLKGLETTVVGETRPDLTLLLDAPPEDLAERRRSRGGPVDLFEAKSLEFHRAIRDAFLTIARDNQHRIKVLNALQSPEELVAHALTAIELLQRHRAPA